MVDDNRGLFGPAAVAENYRRYLQPYLFDRWSQRLVDFARPRVGQTVLDVAAAQGR